MAAQLIFLGDLVELVCSFTDLKILTKLLERMDIDMEIGLFPMRHKNAKCKFRPGFGRLNVLCFSYLDFYIDQCIASQIKRNIVLCFCAS